MKIAFRNRNIDNPTELFGRQEDLTNLFDHAQRLDQVELIGARRFGKTCMLLSLATMLREEKDSMVIPIFVDLKTDGIKGTVNVYRYLTSRVLSTLKKDKWINGDCLDISGMKVTPTDDWQLINDQLQGIENASFITLLFQRIVKYYSSELEQCFLFLFDEYEYMATEAFDSIDGFMLMRQLSMNDNPQTGLPPLIFWLAGASPWSVFVDANKERSVGGSGEFNGITIQPYVTPLDKSAFDKMWASECSAIKDEEKRAYVLEKCDDAFIASGGVPFYANAIGAKLIVTSSFPDYTLLSGHFVELEKLLSETEKKFLREIQSQPISYSTLPSSVTALEKYGLIKKRNGKAYSISIKFYSDFIRASLLAECSITGDNGISNLVEEITKLIYDINENNSRKKGFHVFTPVNDAEIQYQYLRKPATNREEFAIFINAVYITYWERSKGVNAKGIKESGFRLPPQMKRTDFRRASDRLRHCFGLAHEADLLDVKGDQMDKGGALTHFTGYSTEPTTKQEFLNLQISVLKGFRDDLKKLSSIVR